MRYFLLQLFLYVVVIVTSFLLFYASAQMSDLI